MISLELTEKQLDELHKEASENPNVCARKKCWVVYLKGKNYAHREIANVIRVDEDTVTKYLKTYRDRGLAGLLATHYRKQGGQLDAHMEWLKELFKKPAAPHGQSGDRGNLAGNWGMSETFRLPGIFAESRDEMQTLRSCTWQSSRRRKSVPSATDIPQPQAATHFRGGQVWQAHGAVRVRGAFLGMIWCFTRQFLPSSSGRKRYNALGAYDTIRHEVVTVTNDTVVNHETFCALLDKIASIYAHTGLPITLVLDNARYQKCQSVFDKAKALRIELLYLPAYSPNLNLIERLWRFVKKQVLYSTHYDKFANFKESIDVCLRDLGTRFKKQMQTLMTLKFHLFSKTENCTA